MLAFQEKFFKLFEIQSADIKEIKANLSNIRTNAQGQQLPDFASIPPLPINDRTRHGEIEDWIGLEATRKLIIDFLALIGVATVEKNTRKILRKLFSSTLSRQVNFTGKGGKVAFRSLSLLPIIKDSTYQLHRTTLLGKPALIGSGFQKTVTAAVTSGDQLQIYNKMERTGFSPRNVRRIVAANVQKNLNEINTNNACSLEVCKNVVTVEEEPPQSNCSVYNSTDSLSSCGRLSSDFDGATSSSSDDKGVVS